MSIEVLFCCICGSQLDENGFVACCAIAAADCPSAADVCAPVAAWLCASPGLATHTNARTAPAIPVNFCRIIFTFSCCCPCAQYTERDAVLGASQGKGDAWRVVEI